MISSGIWVSAAYTVKATNGMPIHTTMIVAIMKKVSWSANQLWPCRSRAQLTRPYSVSNIHCQTIVAVRAGIAQATMSAADTSSRIPLPRASRSRAMSTPSTIVRATLTKQKINVRQRTVQK